ncbi:MAG: hypothetical protein F4X56_08205 [Gammaproteobacteria bacterium]|nr:TerB family tellurite resistance protein [Gammaproteobacteria bacterium]MXW07914.1 hypothetical protein [Gammaproteobacteria bacterium]MYC25882.1 hypothetical protein [Gammaproteobacteria bacterium]
MISSGLNSILKLFQSGSAKQSTTDIFNETVLMTLARTTNADTNIKHIELEAVQSIVRETTGEEVSLTDIGVAAKSHLFESATLDRYLGSVGKVLNLKQKISLLESVVRVIHSDERVSSREITFFNMVSDALGVTPAELMGLALTE